MVPAKGDNRVTTGPEPVQRSGRLTGRVRVAMLAPPRTEQEMATIDEDDRPKKKRVHEIGQDLALLSVEELNDRILLLNDEVSRLQAALEKKRASRAAADQFFKR